MASDASDEKTRTVFSTEVPECVVKTCYEYRGVIMIRVSPPRILDRLKTMDVRSDDVFVVSYPKSGSTWLKQVLVLLGVEGETKRLEGGKHIVQIIPHLDVVVNYEEPETSETSLDLVKEMPSPRTMCSHSLLDWLPADIRADDPTAKVIYVARNPKDVAVSFYNFGHWGHYIPAHDNWDVFFEEFCKGRVPYGSWFDHVLPWWKRRHHPNVIFLTYEDMTRDLPAVVKKLAHFLGKPVSDDVVDKVTAASTFEFMKESAFSNPDFISGESIRDMSKTFMRRGKVGDWKNYFTVDQNEGFDELYRKKMSHTNIEMEFELPDTIV